MLQSDQAPVYRACPTWRIAGPVDAESPHLPTIYEYTQAVGGRNTLILKQSCKSMIFDAKPA